MLTTRSFGASKTIKGIGPKKGGQVWSLTKPREGVPVFNVPKRVTNYLKRPKHWQRKFSFETGAVLETDVTRPLSIL